MLKLNQKLTRLSAMTGAAFTIGAMTSTSAHASGKTFNDMANNIVGGIATIPGLISAICYVMGLLFAVLGILKIKDHVENPSQTQLKDGAIRLAVGGALLGLPFLLGAMQTLISNNDTSAINGNQVYNIKMLNKAS